MDADLPARIRPDVIDLLRAVLAERRAVLSSSAATA